MSKASLIFLKYHIHYIILSPRKCWSSSTWHSKPFTFQSRVTILYPVFLYTFYCSPTWFSLSVKHLHYLNPILLFSHIISALNAFLLALFKSYPLPNSWRPMANPPYFLKAFPKHIIAQWSLLSLDCCSFYSLCWVFCCCFCFFLALSALFCF